MWKKNIKSSDKQFAEKLGHAFNEFENLFHYASKNVTRFKPPLILTIFTQFSMTMFSTIATTLNAVEVQILYLFTE